MNTTHISTPEGGKDLYSKLTKKQSYCLTRYKYYDDECETANGIKNLVYSTSSDVIKRTIDDIRNRLLIDHFVNAGSIAPYFSKNIFNKVIKSALITGCGFVRIYKNAKGDIELIPYDAYFATGTLNNDNTLSEAISIDSTDTQGIPTSISVYRDGVITTRNIKDGTDSTADYLTDYAPLIPVIFNSNAQKPFGSSFITKQMMKDTDAYKRAKQRQEAVGEILAQSQGYLLGVAKDFDARVKPEIAQRLKDILLITRDSDGNSPDIKTGQSQTAGQYKDVLEAYEKKIEYSTDKAGYADMIASIQYDLIEAVNMIGNAIVKTVSGDPNAALQGEIDVVFKNNDFSNFSPFMDGVLKVNQVVPGYLGKEQLDKILGINGNAPALLSAGLLDALTTEDGLPLVSEESTPDSPDSPDSPAGAEVNE